MPLPVENDTCVHNRSVGNILPPEGASFDELMDWYAGEILGQIPCMRMMDPTGRKKLYNDPSVAGIIYHTVKFCDFYSFEYAEIKNHTAPSAPACFAWRIPASILLRALPFSE